MQSDEYNINYRDDRIYKLLNFLLSQRKSISLTKCADYIYVSKSTLTSDLKELEKDCQDMTDSYIKKIEDLLKEKENEIMEV